jgi:excisionase family DNA binding protein
MTRASGVAPPRKQRSPALPPIGGRPKRHKRVPASEEFLTVPQVAENWHISQRTIRRMIADGRLSVVRIGRAVRIPAKVAAP